MKLRDLFTKKVVTAHTTTPIASVARLMKEHNVGTVVIVEEGRPVGVVTDRDLALAVGAGDVPLQASIERVMSREVTSVHDDAGILTATRLMRDCEVRRLPIVDETGRLVGIVAVDDLLRLLAHQFNNLVEGIKHEIETK